MVAFCDASFFSRLFVSILVLETWPPTLGQMGLRTLPLTDSRNRSSGSLGLFSKWAEDSPSNPSVNEPSIELELAAILRDIAYGVSTEATTTTTTSTTTPKPVNELDFFENAYDSVELKPPSSIPVSPPWEQNLWENNKSESEKKVKNEKENKKSGTRPVQHQYVESPVIEPSDTYDEEENEDVFLEPEDDGPAVVRSDFGVHEVPWLSSIGVMWEVHVYTTAGLFSLILLLSLYCLTRVHLSTHLLPRGYYITVHLLVFLAAFFRCVYFFHDPYAAEKLLPNGLSNLLYNTGTPCIITALAVLILALLRTARLIILPFNLQSPVVVAIISAALIAGSVIIDSFGGLLKDQQIVPGIKGVMQALTAGWGAALCVGYTIVFIRVERAAKRQQNEIVRLTFSRLHVEGSSLPRHMPKPSLKFGARFTLIACISGLLLAALQVYGLINAEVVVDLPPLQPWVWLVYQTSCRLLEITMWSCICIASAMPANLAQNKRNKAAIDEGQILTVLSCNSCTSCTSLSSCCIYKKKPSDDMYSTICQTNHVARNFSIQNEGKIIPQDTIASTGLPPKHISTTLLPPKARKLNKTSTLHSASSDAQLLWNNNSNANSSNSSSRPSSLILTEGGLIKFRTHEPHTDTVRIINYPKKDFDPKVELHETQKKILENCKNPGEDNYINSGALTPEEKIILEHNFHAAKLQQIQNDQRNDVYTNAQQNGVYIRGTKLYRNESPLHDPFKYNNTSSSMNATNSFDVHFYEDDENEFYQSPSLNSSVESGGHIYASIQQPMEQGRFMQQIKNLEDPSQCKILNNSSFIFQTPVHQRQPSSSSQSHTDVLQTDYLTDGSQDYIESPNSDPRSAYVGSQSYLQPSDQFYQSRNGVSPVHGYRSYVPHNKELKRSPQTNIISNDYVQHTLDDFLSRNSSESNQIVSLSPTSPTQKKRFLIKNGSSNFDNVSYTPLHPEYNQYPDSYEENVRPCGHRPRKIKLSPLSNESPIKFPNSSSYHQVMSTQSPQNDEYDKNNTHAPQRERKTSKKEEQSMNEPNPQANFSSFKAQKFVSEGVSSTDLRATQKASSEFVPHESSTKEQKDFDVHSESTDTNADSTEKSMEVRWPLKCKDETGV